MTIQYPPSTRSLNVLVIMADLDPGYWRQDRFETLLVCFYRPVGGVPRCDLTAPIEMEARSFPEYRILLLSIS